MSECMLCDDGYPIIRVNGEPWHEAFEIMFRCSDKFDYGTPKVISGCFGGSTPNIEENLKLDGRVLVKSYADLAKIAVKRIIADLSRRRGLRHEWDQIDDDTQSEIKQVWAAIIEEAFEDK